MNFSKPTILFLVVFISVSLLSYNYAHANQVENYHEEQIDCSETTGTVNVLTIDDSSEFDFIEDESYLILASVGWGGQSGADEYSIRVLHGASTFGGSENTVEPVATNGACGVGDNMYKYFWYDIWTPSSPAQANEDIVIQVQSEDNSDMQYQNVALTIIHLTGDMVEGTHFFHDENTGFEDLGTAWNTPNDASITFTPYNDNDDWLVIGSNRLDSGSGTINYESRIFVNGTETDLPFMSQEGEDVNTDFFVHTMARVFTLPNSTSQTIEMEAQIDEAGAGTHQRTSTSIFALNLNIFDEYAWYWNADSIALSQTDYATEVATLNFTTPQNNQDVFFIADVGTLDTTASKKILARTQIDQIDRPSYQTGNRTEYNNEWDADDNLRFQIGGIRNVDNSTHTVDVDMSATGSGVLGNYRSLIAISLNIEVGETVSISSANNTMGWTDFIETSINDRYPAIDPMSITDNVNATHGFVNLESDDMSWLDTVNATQQFGGVNATDPMSWLDSIRTDVLNNESDNMSWTDIVNTNTTETTIHSDPMSWTDSINTFVSPSTHSDDMSWTDSIMTDFDDRTSLIDPMSWTDSMDDSLSKFRFPSDPNSWLDTINATHNQVETPSDDMSWTDDVIISLNVTKSDPMSWLDSVNATSTKLFNGTDNMSWLDNINATVMYGGVNATDPISWLDSINATLNEIESPSDPISWIDSVNATVSDLFETTDPMSWTDIVNATKSDIVTINGTDNPMSWTDSINTFVSPSVHSDPMSWTDSIMTDFDDRTLVIDPMSWTDVTIDSHGRLRPYSDPMSWFDSVNATLTQVETPSDPISWLDSVNATSQRLVVESDPMSWLDTINATKTNLQTPSDPISWLDNINATVMYGGVNATDPISWLDSINATLNEIESPSDPMSWIDSVNATVSDLFEVSDPMSWKDIVNASKSDIVTINGTDNPMSWTDTINTFVSPVNATDPMSWVDSIMTDFDDRTGVSDPMSWTDTTIDSHGRLITPSDPNTWLDTVNATLNQVEIPSDPMSWTDFINATAQRLSSPSDPMSWLDTANFTKTKLVNATDPFSWTDIVNATFTKSFNATDPMSWIDSVNATLDKPFDTSDPMSWIDSIDATVVFGTLEISDPMSWLDSVNTNFVDNEVVVTPPTTGTGGTPTGGQPVPTIPDSDGDGFLDNVDQCPLEKETVNQFEDNDGCPDSVSQLPVELTQFDVVDDNIVLQDAPAQPQVEDLTVRWLGDSPITITNVEVADSPFDIQVENIPVQFGTSDLGITETKLPYTIQAPNRVCSNDFTFDCVDSVTYDIPVIITGEVDGKIIVTEGRIRVDNSDRVNPYAIIFASMILIPIIALLFWKRSRKRTTKLKVITNPKAIVNPRGSLYETKPTNQGLARIRIRDKDSMKESKPFIIPRSKNSLKENSNMKIIRNERKESKKFEFRDPNKKKKKKRNLFGR